MSVTHSYGIEEIKINDHESILLEKKSEEGYEWIEVTFKVGDKQIFIGSYYIYDYHSSRGWMKYNDDTIAIASESIPSYGINVEKLFDIKTKHFIEGSKEDLLEYYNQQFGNEKQNKESINSKRKLLKKGDNKYGKV